LTSKPSADIGSMGGGISASDGRDADVACVSNTITQSEEVTILDCSVLLHVYDLNPWLGTLNTLARHLDWGAFHVGVEVFGEEWAFSADGIDRHAPCKHPCGYPYRETVCMGRTPVDLPAWRKVLRKLGKEFPRRAYHILKNNCASFASEVCRRLEVPVEVPRWVLGAAATLEASPTMQSAFMSGFAASQDSVVKRQGVVYPCRSKARPQPEAVRCRPTRSHSDIFERGRAGDLEWLSRTISAEDCLLNPKVSCMADTPPPSQSLDHRDELCGSDGFFAKDASDSCAHLVSGKPGLHLSCSSGHGLATPQRRLADSCLWKTVPMPRCAFIRPSLLDVEYVSPKPIEGLHDVKQVFESGHDGVSQRVLEPDAQELHFSPPIERPVLSI